ncbi:hypothetical protein C8F04DRAFT_1197058 [Mycena alexandri]|uniref:Uncharacterized protein n=1 Tax=Mycena alexandri TaxID=1745969 RepID=A0AAD6S2X9_9AGAR|nr:hypothetical protein C8F04DRAFT_1197058 [Mycena alexandri]
MNLQFKLTRLLALNAVAFALWELWGLWHSNLRRPYAIAVRSSTAIPTVIVRIQEIALTTERILAMGNTSLRLNAEYGTHGLNRIIASIDTGMSRHADRSSSGLIWEAAKSLQTVETCVNVITSHNSDALESLLALQRHIESLPLDLQMMAQLGEKIEYFYVAPERRRDHVHGIEDVRLSCPSPAIGFKYLCCTRGFRRLSALHNALEVAEECEKLCNSLPPRKSLISRISRDDLYELRLVCSVTPEPTYCFPADLSPLLLRHREQLERMSSKLAFVVRDYHWPATNAIAVSSTYIRRVEQLLSQFLILSPDLPAAGVNFSAFELHDHVYDIGRSRNWRSWWHSSLASRTTVVLLTKLFNCGPQKQKLPPKTTSANHSTTKFKCS